MGIEQIRTYLVSCDGRYEKDGLTGRCPVSIEVKASSKDEAVEQKLPDDWKVEYPTGWESSRRITCSATHVADLSQSRG